MANKIKGNAASKSAPKKTVQIRPEFQAAADAIKEKRVSLGNLCVDAAELLYAAKGTKEEYALLKSVTTRQQWCDMNTIATRAKDLPKSAPACLAKRAQFVRAQNKGATAAEAKKHAEGKLTAKELENAIAKRLGNALPHPELVYGDGVKDLTPDPVEGEGEGEGETGGKGPDGRKNEENEFRVIETALKKLRGRYADMVGAVAMLDIIEENFAEFIELTEEA